MENEGSGRHIVDHSSGQVMAPGSVKMDRRRFCREILAVILAAAVAGVSDEKSSFAAEETETESPRVLLDRLIKISGGRILESTEQGQSATALIRRYVAALEAGYVPSSEEMAIATDLVVTKLYYPQDKIAWAVAGGAGDLPLAALDMEGALAGTIQKKRKSGKAGDGNQDDLFGRLKGDLLWYNNYSEMPKVWDCAASNYLKISLPGNGPVRTEDYERMLTGLTSPSPISYRVVVASYRRIEADIAKKLDDMTREGLTGQKFLAQWGKMLDFQKRLSVLFPDDYDHREPPNKDCAEYHRWASEHFFKPCVPHLKESIAKPATLAERQVIGRTLAQGIEAEKGLSGIVRNITHCGLEPDAVIMYLPRPTITKPEPYGVGPCTSIFLSLMPGAFGDDSLANYYVDYDRRRLSDPDLGKRFRRNCACLSLSVLGNLAKDEESAARVEPCAVLLALGMREEADRISGLPDLEEWGERVGLYLGIQTGRYLNAENWPKRDKRLIKPALMGGEKKGGVFSVYDQRKLDDIYRVYGYTSPSQKAKVPGSILHKEEIAKDRRAFITSFLASYPPQQKSNGVVAFFVGNHKETPALEDPEKILLEFGFTEEEIKLAKN